MQTAIWAFLAQLAATSGAGAAALAPGQCQCAVSVALAAHGNAVAVGQGGSSGSGGSNAGAGAGATGPALSVSVSGAGSASANSTSGDVGGATGGSTALPGASSITPAENATVLSAEVRGLVATLVTDNAQRSSLDAATTSSFTTSWHAPAPVAAQIAFASSTGTATTLGDCMTAARVTSGVSCTIAISVSLGGTAHATVSPGTGNPGSGCGAGSGAAVAGASAAIAVAADGDAQSLAKRGNDGAGCALAGSAQSGASGASIGLALTTTGSAASSSTSGDSGVPTVHGASTSGAAADASTGRTGDAVGVAIAKLGAIALVRSGNSGAALSTCAGCAITSLPTGGTAIATSVSGNTGNSYSLAIAGLIASVDAGSGNSGAATSLTGIDGATAPATGTGVAAIGRSGQTGDVVALAISPDSSVSVSTHSGVSGGVVNTALEGAICASPAADAVITCTSAATGGDLSGTTPTSSTVQASSPGRSVVTIGSLHHETLVPADPGSSTIGTPSSTQTSGSPADVAAVATLRKLGPTYQPTVQAAPIQRRIVLSAQQKRNNDMAMLAPMVFGSGLFVLSLVVIAAAVVRRRKVRYMRRR